MNKIFALLLVLSVQPALAGSGTIGMTPGSGAAAATTTDGSNNIYWRNTLWDYAAGANGVAVNSSHSLQTSLASSYFDTSAGSSTVNTMRVTMDQSQLAAQLTTATTMSSGYQLVGFPTDQPVSNMVQAQSNGTTSSRVVAASSTNATSLKASAGNAFNIDLFNTAAYTVFVKFYNKASAPTVGTDTPVWTLPIVQGTSYSRTFPFGKSFSTGIAYAITKLQADSDTTAVVAGDVTGAIDWK